MLGEHEELLFSCLAELDLCAVEGFEVVDEYEGEGLEDVTAVDAVNVQDLLEIV